MNDGLYSCHVLVTTSRELKVRTRSVSLLGKYFPKFDKHFLNVCWHDKYTCGFLVYPTYGPVISGMKAKYIEGEVVQANCTAAPSNPPPSLAWYVNGVMVSTVL